MGNGFANIITTVVFGRATPIRFFNFESEEDIFFFDRF